MPRFAALFDLDGVLVNTETLKRQAHHEVANTLGSNLPETFYRKVIGQSKDAVASQAIKLAKLDILTQEYHERFNAFYRSSLAKNLQLAPGSIEILHTLQARGYLCGLVSSSSPAVVDQILTHVRLRSFFDTVVTAADIVNPKPKPDPYVRALDALDVEPSHAVAFEDTEAGLASALDAGLVAVIAVAHELNVDQDLTHAAAIIDDFIEDESVADLVDSLLKGRHHRDVGTAG